MLENERFSLNVNKFFASNSEDAMGQLIHDIWHFKYIDYLKEKGNDPKKTGFVDEPIEIRRSDYYKLVQLLENGAIMQFEIWKTDNRSYNGEIKEM